MLNSKILARRTVWMATSSLMASTAGAAVLAIGGLVLTPATALAADECGVGAAVVCTPADNPYANGIFYVPATDFAIQMQDGVAVDTSGSFGIGLLVVQGGPTDAITVDAPTGVTINTSDAGAFGVLLATNAGDITADIDTVTTSGGGAIGVIATSADGDIVLTTTSVTTLGDGATGINATTNTGDVTVVSDFVSTRGLAAGGIDAGSDSGAVSVTSNTLSTDGANATGITAASTFGATTVRSTRVTTTGDNSIGIQASSTTGLASVVSGAVVTTGANATGININPNHSGSADVTSTSVSAAGAGSQGITAFGGDGVTVTAGSVTANGDAIVASTLPVFIFGTPLQSGNTTVSTTGAITSTNGFAIDAYTARGSVSVTAAAGQAVTGGAGGIRALSLGVGDGGVDGVNDGNITITSNGSVGMSGAPVGGDGISATIAQPASAGRIAITANAIFATGNGVTVVNGGTGTTAVTTSGTVTAGADGVNVVSNGAFTVIAGGALTGGANGIQVNGLNGGVVTVNAGGVVRGLGASAATAVVDVATPTGQTTTINNNGTIRSTNATILGAAGDLAIRGQDGSVTVNNAGRLDGRMDFSGLGAGSSVTVNNAGGAGWHTTGLTTFSAGNDLLSNSATGLIATSGATTFSFGPDTGVAPRDVLTNAGRIVVGETTGASTLTITGLERFNNSGLILLGSLNGTTTDGQTNDRLVISGTGGGTTFVGSTGSVIGLDAFLGSAAQTGCAAATVADCVSLPGGAVSGGTLLRVNNTNTLPGAFNPTGIVLVDATGGSIAAGSFSLDPTSSGYTLRNGAGALDTGLFFYHLTPVGTAQVALVSAPDSEVFEFVGVGQAATGAWYTANSVWFDRQADLRDGLEGQGQSGAGIWMKIVGSQAQRDLTQTYAGPGGPFVFDTGYEQSTVALVGGIDLVRGGGDASAWVFGADIGYLDTDVDVAGSATQASLQGGLYGLYGSYVSGGLFLDASVTALDLDMVYSLPSVVGAPGVSTQAKGGVSSVGAKIEGGWRIALGERSFIEPLAGVAYVKTSIDDLTLPGGVVAFDDMTSLRANIGARIGHVSEFDTFKLKTTAIARVWDEFDGDGQTTLVNGGPDILVTDQFEGVFGEVGGGLDVFSKDERVSAFVNVNYRWNEDWSETAVTLGGRYRW
ncbi:MAG: beta strand repeat-containing protein [Caulobacter sp.]